MVPFLKVKSRNSILSQNKNFKIMLMNMIVFRKKFLIFGKVLIKIYIEANENL